jgi:hypothetical protein
MIVVSGSKDKTARTWLFAEEKSITVLDHYPLAGFRFYLKFYYMHRGTILKSNLSTNKLS